MSETANIGGMFLAGAREIADQRELLLMRVGPKWQTISWSEAALAVREMALGLLERGIEEGDTLAMVSVPTPTSALFGLAVTALRARLLCLPLGLAEGQLAALLASNGVRALMLPGARQAAALEATPEILSGVAAAFVADPEFKPTHRRFARLADVRNEGRASRLDRLLGERLARADLDDPALIVLPRRRTLEVVTLTHADLVAATEAAVEGLRFTSDDVVLLGHSMAEAGAWSAGLLATIHARGRLAFFEEGEPLSELAAAAPTVVLGPPSLAARLRAGLCSVGEAGPSKSGLAQGLDLAEACARGRRVAAGGGPPVEPKPPITARARLAFTKRRICSKAHQCLGGHLRRVVVSGGAPCPATVTFFALLGVEVWSAYGLAETAGPFAFGTARRGWPDSGPLTHVAAGFKLRLSAVGEVEVHAPPGRTSLAPSISESFWRRTGDLGRMDEEGGESVVSILGARDELLEHNGAVLSLPRLELLLEAEPLVERAWVYPGPRQTLLAAIVVDGVRLRDWQQRNSRSLLTPQEAALDSRHQELFGACLARANAWLPPAHRIDGLLVAPYSWSAENGYTSPRGALQRSRLGELQQTLVSVRD